MRRSSTWILIASLLVGLAPVGIKAQEQRWVADSLVKKSLDSLDDHYADVPSALNCRKTKNMAEKLICGNKYLQQAELLNTRARAYAIENATKREINHKHFRGDIPGACTSEQCIYDFFKNQTNDSLGGESPYYEP